MSKGINGIKNSFNNTSILTKFDTNTFKTSINEVISNGTDVFRTFVDLGNDFITSLKTMDADIFKFDEPVCTLGKDIYKSTDTQFEILRDITIGNVLGNFNIDFSTDFTIDVRVNMDFNFNFNIGPFVYVPMPMPTL
jgi:hypothetical protein